MTPNHGAQMPVDEQAWETHSMHNMEMQQSHHNHPNKQLVLPLVVPTCFHMKTQSPNTGVVYRFSIAENIKEPYRCVWPPAICTVGVGGCVSDSCLRHNDSYHRNKTLLAHSFCQLNQTAGQKEFPKEASTPTSTQNRLSGQLTVNGAKRLVQQQPLEMLSFFH